MFLKAGCTITRFTYSEIQLRKINIFVKREHFGVESDAYLLMFGITTPSHWLNKKSRHFVIQSLMITVIRNTFSHTTCQLHEAALSLLLVHWIAFVLVLRFSLETALLSFNKNDLLLDPGVSKKSRQKEGN